MLARENRDGVNVDGIRYAGSMWDNGLYVRAAVGGVTCSWLVDRGATTSLIGEDMYAVMNANKPELSSVPPMRSVNN